jgi:uncharacterized oligopeptide transporter (OPT) family protein
VIIREQLKFPSGFSTAVLIGVLHGKAGIRGNTTAKDGSTSVAAGFASLAEDHVAASDAGGYNADEVLRTAEQHAENRNQEWKANVRLLLLCFLVSGIFTFATYFFPVLRNIPVFGSVAASTWVWTLNPSLAYVGQGIVMGSATTLHMLIGAVLGWGILSPLAKYKGWAPGPVDDWDKGSKGWIVWISLAIMLADAVVSLGYLALRPLIARAASGGFHLPAWLRRDGFSKLTGPRNGGYTAVHPEEDEHEPVPPSPMSDLAPDGSVVGDGDDIGEEHKPADEDDAPADQLIGNTTVAVGLVLSVIFCVLCIRVVFGELVPLYATVVAVFMALLLSIMGVRALGETDLNPVSGISKLAQLFFALIIPQTHKSSVLINLVAGAVVRYGPIRSCKLLRGRLLTLICEQSEAVSC